MDAYLDGNDPVVLRTAIQQTFQATELNQMAIDCTIFSIAFIAAKEALEAAHADEAQAIFIAKRVSNFVSGREKSGDN
jgi:hypothetical protein